MAFIDYSKAFDCVDHKVIWHIMHEMGFPVHLIDLIHSLYADQGATVRREDGHSDEGIK